MVLNVLMVAEKPSIASSIAGILSEGKAQPKGGKLPVYAYSGKFQGRDANFRVTSVAGHVFNLDFAPEYQNWDTTKFVDLFEAKTIKKEATNGIIRHLKEESKGIDAIVLWLDCDKEGENICFEVLNVIQNSIRNIKDRSKVFRARFSSITAPDIRKAMQNLVYPNENESLSVEARQELDLKIGVAFSRFQTKYFQGKYGDLDSTIISYGPCQTPTLGFVVERHDLINQFVPEKYWYLNVVLNKENHDIVLNWKRGRVFDHEVAFMFSSLFQDITSLTVTSINKSTSRHPPPLPLNTVEMLRLASKVLGMGPQETMQIAERLYLNGFISYPRTESTSFPQAYDIVGNVRQQTSHPLWGTYASNLIQNGIRKPRKGVDAGDHPPITPTSPAGAGALSGGENRLYELICKHFLASLSQDSESERVRVTLEGGNEVFSYSYTNIIKPGFTEILYSSYKNFEDDDDDEEEKDSLYNITFLPNEVIPIKTKGIKEALTSPPKYLMEHELISLMESNSIGTDASIATHINNIITRNYVTVTGNRQLVPSKLGIVLVHGYYSIDSDLVESKLRRNMERECNLIANGNAKLQDVVNYTLNIFRNKFLYFIAHISLMNSLFEPEFSSITSTGRFLSRCGICKHYMNYISAAPQRLYCQTCNSVYKLPQNGTIKQYKELKCPLDNFELVMFSTGNSAKALGTTYLLCPYCYNNPPFEDLCNMGCNSCLNPSCIYGLHQNGVCLCPNSIEETPCSGMMVLDRESKPNWKLCCNKCNYLIKFTTPIHMIRVLYDEKCPECESSLLNIEFNKTNTPLHDGKTSYEGCILCDDFLNNMIEAKKGRMKHISLIKKSKGKGRKGKSHRKHRHDDDF
ncbi:hypothetical protein WA158_002162 [Blastocystis sp. Blastoise]